MTLMGIWLGLISILVVGLGFVWVIRGERYLGVSWWLWFMLLGIGLAIGSLFVSNQWLAAVMGISGGSFIWGSTEMKEQAIRAELGWFPYNPRKVRAPLQGLIEKIPPPSL
ncbi:MAG TPA: DUF4491 family protein [Anaerolineales bacterium]|nr:DUF4491 family protein [Anaerolineales bacterium]